MLTPGRAGDFDARIEGELLALVYGELRQLASRLMRRERADHTLSPTAVVHEAVLRLLGDANFATVDRSYLLAAASRAMREVLIDHARRRAADRRGGRWHRVSIDAVVEYSRRKTSISWWFTRLSTGWPRLMNA